MSEDWQTSMQMLLRGTSTLRQNNGAADSERGGRLLQNWEPLITPWRHCVYWEVHTALSLNGRSPSLIGCLLRKAFLASENGVLI